MKQKNIFVRSGIGIFSLALLLNFFSTQTFASNPGASCGVAQGPGICVFEEDAGGIAQCQPVCNSDNISGTVTCPSCHNSIQCVSRTVCGSQNYGSSQEQCVSGVVPGCQLSQLTHDYCPNEFDVCCKITPTPSPTDTPTPLPTITTVVPTAIPTKAPLNTPIPTATICPIPTIVTNVQVTCPFCDGQVSLTPTQPTPTATVIETPTLTITPSI